MSSTSKYYTVFNPTNPLLNRIAALENPAIKSSMWVKYNPGGCVLPENFNQYYDEVQEFPVEDSDIWIVSFPKAGTTWITEMIWLLTNNYDIEGAKILQDERCVFFEVSAVTGQSVRDVLNDQTTSFQRAREMSPRLIKTHLPLNLLPAKLRNGEKRPRIVYVTRHPKDIVVSFYHHRVLLFGYRGSLDDMVQQFTSDMTIWAPYWTHVREFWERRNEPNIYFLKYEDMKQDLSKVIQELAHFLDVSAPNELQLKSILEHLSFNAMKANPHVNKDGLTDKRIQVHGVERKTHFMRKGKVGSWKEELSTSATQILDQWIEKNKIDGLYDKDF